MCNIQLENLSHRTAWLWLHKLRCAMVRPGREKLSGIVEADEIFIGDEKRRLPPYCCQN
jgi:hypothetical protein